MTEQCEQESVFSGVHFSHKGDVRLQTTCKNLKSCVQLVAAFRSSLTTALEGAGMLSSSALCVQLFVYLGSSSFSS